MARLFLIACWVGAIVVAAVTDTAPCTPEDPSFCGPDQTFAWFSVFLLATPVLLLWRPLAGCVAGVAFGAADQVIDDLHSANIVFGLHAAMCFLVAVALVEQGRRQRRAVQQLTRGTPSTPTTQAPPEPEWDPLATVLAVLGVLAALAFLGWYEHQVDAERVHLVRAVTVSAVVRSLDDDEGTVSLARPDGVSATVSPLDHYDVGDVIPLRIDPTDPSWARMVAEPADPTGWETAGLLSLTFAALLTGEQIRRRRATRRLWGADLPAVLVRSRVVDPPDLDLFRATDERDGVGAHTSSAGASFARLVVEHVLAAPGTDGDTTAGDAPDRALDERRRGATGNTGLELVELRGGVSVGGRALVVSADGRTVFAGRLVSPTPWRRVTLRRALRWGSDDVDDEPDDEPARPVHASTLRRLPELPVTAQHPARTRAMGWLLIVAGVLGGPVAELLVADGRYQQVFIAVLGGQVARAGAARALTRLRLTRAALVVHGPWTVVTVPWSRIRDVERFHGELGFDWDPDGGATAGPFAPGPFSDAPPDNDLRTTPSPDRWEEDRAEQIGAAALVLRDRSLAAGSPGRDVSTGPGPGWLFLALYPVLLAVVFLLA